MGIAAILCLGTAAMPNVEASHPRAERDVFQPELDQADAAPDRDGKVEHLWRAISLRPGDPRNIVLEFQIAIMLGQNPDPTHGQPVRLKDSLEVLEGIVRKYRHEDYYNPEPFGVISGPAFMVPRAAILAASTILALSGDKEEARRYLRLAMTQLQWTFDRWRRDWLSAPNPATQPAPWELSTSEKSKLDGRVRRWEELRDKAARGDVVGSFEDILVRSAVRQYGLSFGRQKPEDVRAHMEEIIRQFPDTAMARVAQGHIERAAQMMASAGSPTTPPAPPAPARPEPRASSTRPLIIAGAALLALGIAVALWIRLRRRRRRGWPADRGLS